MSEQSADHPAESSAAAPEVTATPLVMPRDGVPVVIDSDDRLAAAITALRGGSGPVSIDTERASGYRYSQRAYLVQLRRDGSGTHLIDPTQFHDLVDVQAAIRDELWILHAASQDLPCLEETGLVPRRLFDTEVAGRILGFDKVSLGAMLESQLSVALAKEHSAADWSTRPLPEPWLIYAALDVELLSELREVLLEQLTAAGKLEWAEQEFEALRTAPPPPPRQDPWRRVSGIHSVKGAAALAEVRELWRTRDEIARRRDISPGRILPDRAIIAAVSAKPTSREDLLGVAPFSGPRMRRQVDTWWKAIRAARALDESQLPTVTSARADGPPSGSWQDRDPVAAGRLSRAREAIAVIAEQHRVQVESVLEPAVIRRIAWAKPAELGDVAASLQAAGARPWQVELTAAPLQAALLSP